MESCVYSYLNVGQSESTAERVCTDKLIWASVSFSLSAKSQHCRLPTPNPIVYPSFGTHSNAPFYCVGGYSFSL